MPSVQRFQPPDGGYGWMIVISSVLITSSITPIVQCFGLIYEKPFKEADISATQISFLLHLYNSIMCTFCFVAGPLLKKFSFRQVALAGSLAVSVGVSATYFSSRYEYLLGTFCIFIGIGQGLIIQSVSLAINTYFKKRLTLAMSYSVTGTGLLPIVTPQVTNLLLANYNTQGTVLILAGISLHSLAGALLLRPPYRKSKPNREQNVAADGTADEVRCLIKDELKLSVTSKIKALLNLELLKESSFVILIVGMSISYVAELNFNLINPFVLAELTQLNRDDVALAMSIQASGDITGRLLIPLISHRLHLPAKHMYLTTLIVSCIGRQVLISFCDTRIVILTISILVGLAKGARAVFQSLVLPEYINIERLPVATGFLMILNGVLSIAIGPIIGFVHDYTDTYIYALQTASLLSMGCVVLWLLDQLVRRVCRSRSHEEQQQTTIS
ncbi:monocarboxylate transporter 13-like isoform X1 [Photinus pyralis]|uniref:Major facilitator superfamily (MFS) profile domain-containing protein n=2 Tax=Photinus pyralis TaxID=7054 RepID=A0A1Y1L2J6_PHOPY|nr:monocarboxylate transporter 13-like isoform X1 [Photinus pyralis]